MQIEVTQSTTGDFELLVDGRSVATSADRAKLQVGAEFMRAIEQAERHYATRLDDARRLLALAAHEIRSHSVDYHHRTPEALIRQIEQAAKP